MLSSKTCTAEIALQRAADARIAHRGRDRGGCIADLNAALSAWHHPPPRR
jgi:hypothetical protein